MKTPDLDLIPQAEEDIEKAAWFDIKSFIGSGDAMYNSIRDVLDAYLEEGSTKF